MAGPENTSGQGPGTPLPPELQGFNWGALLLNWIWCIPHQAWLGLVLSLVVGIIGAILCGVKGNEWAWQNRRFASIQEFRDVQAAWTKWGVILIVVWIVLLIGMVLLSVVIGALANR